MLGVGYRVSGVGGMVCDGGWNGNLGGGMRWGKGCGDGGDGPRPLVLMTTTCAAVWTGSVGQIAVQIRCCRWWG